jgi:thymidylate synthase (FAD)
MQQSVFDLAEANYKLALSKGITKEYARILLPEGMTKTTLYVNGTLRAWINYIDIRTSMRTPKEHRDIVIECALVISNIFPMINDFVKR